MKIVRLILIVEARLGALPQKEKFVQNSFKNIPPNQSNLSN